MRQANTIKLVLIGLFLVGGLALLLKPRGRSMEEVKAWVRKDFPDVPQITIPELLAWQQEESRPQSLLVDVRTAEEFEVSHLPGAVHLEPNTLTRPTIERFGTNRPAVFYCSVGYRASITARNVSRVGWKNVSVLEGSIFEWANLGLPLQSRGQPTKWVHPHSASYVRLLPPDARAPLPQLQMILNEVPPLEKFRLSLGIGLLLLFLTWESFVPAFHWFRNRRERLLHGWRNYALGLINVVLAGLIFVHLWLYIANWADAHNFGLFYWARFPDWLRILSAILLLDFWTYTWHWLNHRIPFLWRFHRTHHSELHMDISSAVRFHFGEIAFSALLRIPIILLLGLKFHELVLYELLLFAVVQFHHANISLPPRLEKILRLLIATPGFHRVHHSMEWTEANSNYGSFLSCWDSIFKTANVRQPNPRFGVKGMETEQHHTLLGMIETPLN